MHTPHSRTPSRTGTPTGSAPSRFAMTPTLRSSPSLSNLQVNSMAKLMTNTMSNPHAGVESSASSVVNLDMGEGILVPDADAEVDIIDGEVGTAVGRSGSNASDEASKKALRDQLRHTLSKRESPTDMTPRRRHRRRQTDSDAVDEITCEMGDAFPPRQYYVLTDAGKPVFTSRSVGHGSDDLTSTIGIMQALLSVFLDDNDKLRCINAGNTRINFLVRSPLYYACVSSWGEPESVDLLYIVLVGRGRVISLARPRKHSIHPADLQILINTAHSPSIVNSSASASWLPLCLPKFDPAGFVNAYITFLQEPPVINAQDIASQGESEPGAVPGDMKDSGFIHKASGANASSAIGLLCVSGNGDFESIRNYCSSITKRLESEGTLRAITKAIRDETTEYSVSELSIPGLRHFIYKSRAHVQITAPMYEDPYDSIDEQRRLITLYQTLHDNIHARSGQGVPLKLQYIRTQKESVMGWITQPFEMYIALSHWLPKSAAVSAANAVARWVKKEEARLFLRDAPVF
ncbi:hypothetical protein HETIRDRAFT_417684 [Heterobasidion irregulare TC 32-1]|uniref:Vacuolar fusion protein MON1 n=1 Tax=Heterobasidion irregulare (strain TC 32-1) TaxID=747525 RepID=W4K6Z3_HETIT|nr:uncharacterized protein HETIRDRAFT_417684 [Heterobasidion irregulare TC 32-1]ETW81578.1 hypothetical protein HETIRDRAFT_417684 [Heterobasidion irregulare TC 32-1]